VISSDLHSIISRNRVVFRSVQMNFHGVNIALLIDCRRKEAKERQNAANGTSIAYFCGASIRKCRIRPD
jgi:hypothetical protein